MITLGIIGIVAAMTLPSVIGHFKKKEIESKLKKFYSTFSQAILLSENDNGPSKDWDKTYYLKNEDGSYNSAANRDLTMTYFNTYLKPYLKHIKIEENPKDLQDELTGEAELIRVYLADGSTVSFRNGACTDVHYDVNGPKLPNRLGQDRFVFIICPEEKAANECGGRKNWCAYGARNTTRESAIQMCKSTPSTCAALIQIDGWEIKEDYPYLIR